jgi:hypothetical protein
MGGAAEKIINPTIPPQNDPFVYSYSYIRRNFMKLSKGMITLGVVGVLVLSLLGWFVGGYNGLVTQRNKVDQAAAQLDSAYQRRFDLVPNLVESAKGAQAQEQKVFGDLAALVHSTVVQKLPKTAWLLRSSTKAP